MGTVMFWAVPPGRKVSVMVIAVFELAPIRAGSEHDP